MNIPGADMGIVLINNDAKVPEPMKTVPPQNGPFERQTSRFNLEFKPMAFALVTSPE
jgi:hypothetical protein